MLKNYICDLYEGGIYLFVAIDKNNHRVQITDAVKGEEYFCPVCRNSLIVKDGKINEKHFAHVSGECSDDWHYDMSDWHLRMQNYFEEKNVRLL